MRTKIIALVLIVIITVLTFTGCTPYESRETVKDEQRTIDAVEELIEEQPTPTDIDYSLERYNLIRRAYWVNGQREKAISLSCEVEKPLGYITLVSHGVILGTFTVDGKVSSLNSFLTGNYRYYYQYSDGTYSTNQLTNPIELADIDGSYGENDDGIFFFTVDGKYVEWAGEYLYTDIPMTVSQPVIEFKVED